MAKDLSEYPPLGDQASDVPDEGPEQCLDCGAELVNSPLYQRYRVCPRCRFHYSIPAMQRIDLLTDPGTFQETNQALVPVDPLSFQDNVSYRERLAEAQRLTGLIEAVVTGTANIGGMQAVVACMDFGFMTGSIGSAVGEKITAAAELALQRRLPFVLMATGGAPRIQEGVLSLMQLGRWWQSEHLNRLRCSRKMTGRSNLGKSRIHRSRPSLIRAQHH